MTQRFKRALRRLVAAGMLTGAAMLGHAPATAAEAGYPLDPFPHSKLTEQAALQNGARLFVNYCLNCHSANLMRYNRLGDLGLTDEQIRRNLLFTGDKVGDPMQVAMLKSDAREWFGATPPDLSVIARARSSHAGTGSDWLYTFMRTFYRDSARASGWNNAVFPNVAMPHAMWELQGMRGAIIEEIRRVPDGFERQVVTLDAQGRRTEAVSRLEGTHWHEGSSIRLPQAEGGRYTRALYDDQIGDLVAYITYMSDPSREARVRLGVWVLLFLSLFTFVTWWLNRIYWKDVK
jgi:ubiquinol-cytochrome c reductase cytochrome c1 subunit